MSISIRNPEVKRLAAQLAEREDTNLTEAIRSALELALRKGGEETADRRERIAAAAAACAALPDLDMRNEDEILGYGADGAFRAW